MTEDEYLNKLCDERLENDRLREEVAYWRAKAERAVEVKPLVWKNGADGYWWASEIGEIWRVHLWRGLSRCYATTEPDLGTFPTLEAAKEAAQADYEARILSAIQKEGDA